MSAQDNHYYGYISTDPIYNFLEKLSTHLSLDEKASKDRSIISLLQEEIEFDIIEAHRIKSINLWDYSDIKFPHNKFVLELIQLKLQGLDDETPLPFYFSLLKTLPYRAKVQLFTFCLDPDRQIAQPQYKKGSFRHKTTFLGHCLQRLEQDMDIFTAAIEGGADPYKSSILRRRKIISVAEAICTRIGHYSKFLPPRTLCLFLQRINPEDLRKWMTDTRSITIIISKLSSSLFYLSMLTAAFKGVDIKFLPL